MFINDRARPDIVGDIGNSDNNDPAAFVIRRWVGLGPDRIIVIAGIRGIDGNQRYISQIFACGIIGFGQFFHRIHHRCREDIGNTVRMDGDQADLFLVIRIAENLPDPCGGDAGTPPRLDFKPYQVTVFGIISVALVDHPVAHLLAVHGADYAAPITAV